MVDGVSTDALLEFEDKEGDMPEQYAAFFKCFSTSSRNRMLRLLAQQGELSVEELARRIGLNETTVSRHLQLLGLQGIVNARNVHPARYYSLNEEFVARKFAQFLAFVGLTPDDAQPNPSRRPAARPDGAPVKSRAQG